MIAFSASATAPASAQLHCGNLEILPGGTQQPLFTFDEFRDYQGGVTLSTIATLRLNIEDQAIPDPACSWFLTVEIDNNPSAGTPANEWEELAAYGTGGGNNPTIDALELRVRNSCQTSPIDGTFISVTTTLVAISGPALVTVRV